MTKEEFLEALNMKMESLRSDIDWALDNGDEERARVLGVQLRALEARYETAYLW